MRSIFFGAMRAAYFLTVGVALFLSGCQPKTIPERPFEKAAEPDLFSLAEQDYRLGNLKKALEGYHQFFVMNPGGDNAPVALHRIAGIYYGMSRYDDALRAYDQVMRDYPGYPKLPEVQFEAANVYYRLGDYTKSNLLATRWIKEYPTHPFRAEALILIGNNNKALGNTPEAFFWWFKASREPRISQLTHDKLSERITELILKAPMDDLKATAVYAEGSPFAPLIHHRIASLHLEAGDLEEAKRAAMNLVKSTTEQKWVSMGRQILESVEDALSVKVGAIGCLLPLSGPFSIYGREVLNGIQLGLGIFNDSREGPDFELIIKDTHGNEEDAVKGVQELAEQGKVIAILGPLASKTATVAAKKAQELKVPIITLTQKEGITSEGDMVFRNFLTPGREIQRILDKAMDDVGWKRFGIIYPDNSYGRALMNLFWDQVEKRDGSIRAVETYKEDETDFAVQIKKMVGLFYPRPESIKFLLREMRAERTGELFEEGVDIEEEPEPIVDFDAVFIPDHYQQVALIAPQFPFHNVFDIHFLGTSLWQSEELIEQAGDYIQGAIFSSGFFRSGVTGPAEDFVEVYKKNFESEPGLLAATGYDTMMFIKNFMKKKSVKTRKDFRKALLEAENYPGLTGIISFDREGEVTKEPLLLTVSGRRLQLLQ
ncbi:MAG: penicillin-binding protein activator [Pseudomonadota bacterium]